MLRKPIKLNFGAKGCFALIIAIILITDIAILLDVPVLRVIFGFLCFTIVPGMLILFVLKLNKIGIVEKIVLSVGLSISFLMFFGVFIDKLYFSLGYVTPLSTISLVVTFSAAMIILCIIGYKTNKEAFSFGMPDFNLNTAEKAFLIVPVIFPALSIFGMHVLNTTDNNIILMFLLFLIPSYVVFVCFFNHKFPKRLYPVVIFLISISLILLMSLRSNHLTGYDVHTEYYFFQTTFTNLHWSVFGHSTLDACLGISLLPAIYQSILNVNSEYLFKVLYSVLYSVSPLAIYVISKRYIGESYGFLASCFFMFQAIFLETAGAARSNLAALFFALAMMTLFSDKIEPLKKRMLFIVFMASCMVSHYSTTYIFFFILLGAFVGIEVLSKKYSFKKVISLTIILLFFSMIFFWYSQVTETAFNEGVHYIDRTLSSLNMFFVEESRGESTQVIFGKEVTQLDIPQKIEWVFSWLTFVLIGIGVVTLIIRYKEMLFPELKFKKVDFLKDKFEVGYFVIALACAGLLVAMVAFPYISTGYTLERLYGVAIVILSVFFVIGGITLSKHFFFFTKRKPVLKEKTAQIRAYLIILLVLIPYYLCATGVMCNIFGDPRNIILNSEGEQYDRMYIHDHYLIAGEWLSSSDVVEGRLVNKQKMIYNMTEYLGMFDEKSRIYDNGGSEVWG